MGQFFRDPALLGKLAANPKTAPHMRDPGFVAKIQAMASGGQVDFANMLQDKRMLDVLSVAMGIDMVRLVGIWMSGQNLADGMR